MFALESSASVPLTAFEAENAASWEFSGSARMRGGAGRTRTNNQTVMGGGSSPTIAKMLGVSDSWLAKSRLHGTGPHFTKIGRAVRYALSAVREFILSRRRIKMRQLEILSAVAECGTMGKAS